MLTTTDNPYSPFTQFDDWKAFDEAKGYYTCEYLARILLTSDSLSKAEQEVSLLTAIDEILELNLLGIYTKVTMDDQEVQEVVEKENKTLS
jgi:hypothetical protein